MNLSRKWLNEFVSVDANDKDFAEAMTLSGSKVEGTTFAGEEIVNVVVGKVLSITRHTNSDHMWVCQMDLGEDESVQIVTGAQNVKEGDLVPVAKHKSLLPGGKKIEKGKLRGEVSYGMLCSFAELGLDQRDFPNAYADGIWILSEDSELGELYPGQDIRSAVGLDDHVVEFEITPNRPDCLSVIGLAREAAATFDAPLTLHTPVVKGGAEGDLNALLKVETPASDLCPRYTARMVRNVKIAPSPLWMRERLRSMGVRPINNIVDITNYVMLEYGQPMHAFDYRYVKGGKIIVRRAEEGEELTTLDGNVRKLTADHLVIADDTRAVGLAGIMGGENSEIVEDTVDVVFESANFNGTCIRKGALALGMRTEASAKFEKGLDIRNTLPAVERACELVELLGAGEVVDGIIDIVNDMPAPTVLKLESDKINALLGTEVSEDEMVRILRKLDFTVNGDMVTVPSWRGDVLRMADLAEEVARFYGYNNIPITLLRGDTTCGGWSDVQKCENTLGQSCRAMGYDEIITYSFISPTYYDKIGWAADDSRRDSLKILNPLGEDTSIMRTTILPSMLEILTRNYNYRNKSVRLYELGKIYFKREDGLADEPKVLALGAYGGGMDFYGIKGAVEELLDTLRIKGARFLPCKDNVSYHPGRCACLYVGEKCLGVLGQIHPAVAANYGVDEELYCAELMFDALYENQGETPVYVPLPRFPATTRDLSVVCTSEKTVAELSETILASGGKYLKGCSFVDIYTGSPIPEGHKSVTFALTLRADDETLTAEHAEETMKNILAALESVHGAVIR